jgi:hypothetical protein
MEKIFLAIAYSVGFMIFIGVIFYLIEKFLGITAVPKYGSRSPSDIQNDNRRLLEHEQKNNPILVKFAISNIEKKHYAVTTINILSEIDNIKKNQNLMAMYEELRRNDGKKI